MPVNQTEKEKEQDKTWHEQDIMRMVENDSSKTNFKPAEDNCFIKLLMNMSRRFLLMEQASVGDDRTGWRGTQTKFISA